MARKPVSDQVSEASPMIVNMNLLRPDDFRATLRKDGWTLLATAKKEELDATHPEVRDENAARIRLDRLGLLTSGSLRIEFRPRRRMEFAERKDAATRIARRGSSRLIAGRFRHGIGPVRG